jgi:hypothetical protein
VILFNFKTEWNSDTCYNKDEPRRLYAKGNKSGTKGQILYNFIFMRCLGQANSKTQKIKQRLPEVDRERIVILTSTEFLFGMIF